MRFLILSLMFLVPGIAFAAAAPGYQMLEPIPFVKGTDEGGRVSFTDLLSGFFELSLVLGAALTAVMLTIGGVQYMTSDAIGGKQAGKERIRNSLTGFLLLLGIYVILKTINPALLNFDLRQIVDAGCKQAGVCQERKLADDRTVHGTKVGDLITAPPADNENPAYKTNGFTQPDVRKTSRTAAAYANLCSRAGGIAVPTDQAAYDRGEPSTLQCRKIVQ